MEHEGAEEITDRKEEKEILLLMKPLMRVSHGSSRMRSHLMFVCRETHSFFTWTGTLPKTAVGPTISSGNDVIGSITCKTDALLFRSAEALQKQNKKKKTKTSKEKKKREKKKRWPLLVGGLLSVPTQLRHLPQLLHYPPTHPRQALFHF